MLTLRASQMQSYRLGRCCCSLASGCPAGAGSKKSDRRKESGCPDGRSYPEAGRSKVYAESEAAEYLLLAAGLAESGDNWMVQTRTDWTMGTAGGAELVSEGWNDTVRLYQLIYVCCSSCLLC